MPNFDLSNFGTTQPFEMTTTQIASANGNNGDEPTCHESFILILIFHDFR